MSVHLFSIFTDYDLQIKTNQQTLNLLKCERDSLKNIFIDRPNKLVKIKTNVTLKYQHLRNQFLTEYFVICLSLFQVKFKAS